MARVNRIVTRAGMKAKLKQLQQAVKLWERQSHIEFKRGYELGGAAMKKAILQAQDEAQPQTKLDGE